MQAKGQARRRHPAFLMISLANAMVRVSHTGSVSMMTLVGAILGLQKRDRKDGGWAGKI